MRKLLPRILALLKIAARLLSAAVRPFIAWRNSISQKVSLWLTLPSPSAMAAKISKANTSQTSWMASRSFIIGVVSLRLPRRRKLCTRPQLWRLQRPGPRALLLFRTTFGRTVRLVPCRSGSLTFAVELRFVGEETSVALANCCFGERGNSDQLSRPPNSAGGDQGYRARHSIIKPAVLVSS